MGGGGSSKTKTTQLPKGATEQEIERIIADQSKNFYGKDGMMTNISSGLYDAFMNGGGMESLSSLFDTAKGLVGSDAQNLSDIYKQQQDLTSGKVNQGLLDSYNGYMSDQVENSQGKLMSQLGKRGMTQNSSFQLAGQNDINRALAAQSSKNYSDAWDKNSKGLQSQYDMTQGNQTWLTNALSNMYSPISALDSLAGNGVGNLSAADEATQDQFQTNTTTSSCFIEGTMITMEDESLKRIEYIQIGDKVLGLNEYGEIETKEVIYIKTPDVSNNMIVKVFTDRGDIICTIDQEFYHNGEETKISNINVGDYISIITPTTFKGKAKVLDVTKLDINPITYHFDVSGFNFFFANGFAVAGIN